MAAWGCAALQGVVGTTQCPILTVFRSSSHVSCPSVELELKGLHVQAAPGLASHNQKGLATVIILCRGCGSVKVLVVASDSAVTFSLMLV